MRVAVNTFCDKRNWTYCEERKISKVKNTRDLLHLNKVIRRLSETQFPSPIILGRVPIRQLLPEARARKWGLAVSNPQRVLVLLFIIIDKLTQLIDIQH